MLRTPRSGALTGPFATETRCLLMACVNRRRENSPEGRKSAVAAGVEVDEIGALWGYPEGAQAEEEEEGRWAGRRRQWSCGVNVFHRIS